VYAATCYELGIYFLRRMPTASAMLCSLSPNYAASSYSLLILLKMTRLLKDRKAYTTNMEPLIQESLSTKVEFQTSAANILDHISHITPQSSSRPGSPISEVVNNSISPSPRTFALFPQLAPELRDEIWRLALPGPRIIQLHTEVDIWSLHLLGCPLEYFTVDHRSYGGHHPAILSVNRESRSVALRHLTKRFHCYWNLKTDVAYIAMGTCRDRSGAAFRHLGELDDCMLEEVRSMRLLDGFRNLAIDCGLWNDGQLSKWLGFLSLVCF